MALPKAFTQQEYQLIKSTTRYHPEDGTLERIDFRFKEPVWRKVELTPSRDGYFRIGYLFDGKLVKLLAHRVAYLLMTGELYFLGLDHIDGDRANNRFSNLRIATPSQNQWNRRDLGVYCDNRAKKWQVRLNVDGKRKYLGLYKDKDEAIAVYRKAHAKAFGEFSPWFKDYGQSDEIEEALAA